MKKQNITDKLAQGVRQAKHTVLGTGERSTPETQSVSQQAQPECIARHSDQSPPESLYQPWTNLHPERIWPD